MKSREIKVILALIACLALVAPAIVTAQTLITFSTTLTGSNNSYSTPQFDLATSIVNSVPPNGLKDAYVYVTLGTDVSWSSMTVTVSVQSGNSVSVAVSDPSNFEVASGQVAGQPGTFLVQSPLATGAPYTIHVEQLQTTGSTDLIEVSVKAAPASSPTPPPPPTGISANQMLLYGGVAVVIVAAVLLAFVFVRRSGGAEQETAVPAMAPMPPAGPSPFGGGETTVIQGGGATKQYYAGFEMPGGQVVPITDVNKEFGREDFKAYLPVDVQTLISRRHFKVSFSPREKTFLIEDLGSANGTMVNNSEIKGKGRMPLKNDDVVSLGGVVNMKFKG